MCGLALGLLPTGDWACSCVRECVHIRFVCGEKKISISKVPVPKKKCCQDRMTCIDKKTCTHIQTVCEQHIQWKVQFASDSGLESSTNLLAWALARQDKCWHRFDRKVTMPRFTVCLRSLTWPWLFPRYVCVMWPFEQNAEGVSCLRLDLSQGNKQLPWEFWPYNANPYNTWLFHISQAESLTIMFGQNIKATTNQGHGAKMKTFNLE